MLSSGVEAEIRRLAAEEARRALDVLAASSAAAVAELRDDLCEAVAELHQRIDAVHERALRALTDQINRKGKG